MNLRSKIITVITAVLLVLAMIPQMEAPAYAEATGVDFSSYVNTTTVFKFNGLNWYIIGDSTKGVRPESGTVTLFSADCLSSKSVFSLSEENYTNKYDGSRLKKNLDWYYSDYFKDKSWTIKSVDLTDVGVTGANLWPLSKEEAQKLPNSILICNNQECWWLRTPDYADRYSMVFEKYDGNYGFGGCGVNHSAGVRPALKLDLRYVDFDNDTKTFTPIKDPPIIHKHDNIEFVKWTDELAAEQYGGSDKKATNSLPREEGDYYLAQDVDLGRDSWDVPAGTTNLCLNGHNITSTEEDDGTVVLDNKYSTLSIYDEHTGDSAGVISSEETGVLLDEDYDTFNMYGGKISGCEDCGVDLNDTGTVFNMYNGEISKCYDGVDVDSDATFILHNGVIKENSYYGVDSSGTIRIENGSITSNKTGINTSTNTKGIILQGSNISPVIAGNTEHNLLLYRSYDLKIRVSEGTTISGDANIGVYPTKGTTPETGVFTDGLAGKIQGEKNVADIFKSDDGGYFVSTAESGEAQLEKNEQPAVDPVGCIDAVNGKEGSIDVAGWAYDPSDTSQAVDVKVYIGGKAGTAGAEDHTIKADKERADVDEAKHCGNYHGFSDTITTTKRGEQPIYIYATNIGEGKDVLLGNRTVTISDSTPSPDPSPTPDPTPAPDPSPTPDPKDQKGDDGVAADKIITQMKGEKDLVGSEYGVLQARSAKQTKSSVKLIWKKSDKAKTYVIYGTACGKNNRLQKLATVTGTSYNATKAGGKKIKKGTYYKFIVVALDEKGSVVSTSKMVHAATAGGKIGNHKAVTTKARKSKVALKKGKTFKLKAKAVPKSKKLKVKIHRGTSYESLDPKTATVSTKGVITAKAKGKCVVYAYAQNGVSKAIKVTVR